MTTAPAAVQAPFQRYVEGRHPKGIHGRGMAFEPVRSMIANDRFDPRERTERVVSYLRDLRNRLGAGRSADAGSPASHALRPAS